MRKPDDCATRQTARQQKPQEAAKPKLKGIQANLDY